MYEVIDAHSEYLARHVFNIFDPDTVDFVEAINDYYNHTIIGTNICLIENVTVRPKFRGHRIGIKAIKDIIFHYSSACGLFVIQPYPLQFDHRSHREDYAHLALDKFEDTEAEAFKKLKNHYKKMGFETIKGFKDLLFYNPAVKNPKLDKLDLEEDPFDKQAKA